MSKRLLLIVSLILVGIILFGGSSCYHKNAARDEVKEEGKAVPLQLYATLNGINLKAHDTSWDKGDEIGLFATSNSASWGNKGANLQYRTKEGNGHFAAVGSGLMLTEEPLNIVAYYPYASSISGDSYTINLADQSNPAKIDLLYSNKVSGVMLTKPVALLNFGHKLSKLVVEVQGVDAVNDLSGLEVTVSNVALEGTMTLSDGTIQMGDKRQEVRLHQEAQEGKKARLSAILFPGEQLKEKKFTFKVSGNTYTYMCDKEWTLEANTRYRIRIVLGTKETKGSESLKIEEWDIKEKKPEAGGEQGGSSDGGTTQPKPAPAPTPNSEKAWYMEVPVSANGQPIPDTYEKVILHMAPDNWFGGNHHTAPDGKRRNYCYLYSTKHVQPLWVAYPLYPDCFGETQRTNDWEYDPVLARQYQPNLKSSYKRGQSRGHMLASSARTATRDLNKTTFYYTNMIPQVQAMNGGGWQKFEQMEQKWAKETSKYDTLYVVTGPILPLNGGSTVRDNSNKTITVPTHSFKVLLKKEKSTGKWYSIGIKMPNSEEAKRGNSWMNFIVSVKSLEEELGFRFFTHLDPSVADEVKSQKDRAHWQ